jgi:ubiquitin conjugation factor E4 B
LRHAFPNGRKPLGPAEFLPLLLSLTPEGLAQSNPGQPTQAPSQPGCLSSTDLLPFLNDLAAGFSDDTLADVLTPTLSLFFQQWFSITPAPDLLGNEWQRYMGAISTLVQVKDIAAAVRNQLHRHADISFRLWVFGCRNQPMLLV